MLKNSSLMFKLTSSTQISQPSKKMRSTALMMLLGVLFMGSNIVQCVNEPDCLEYSDPSAVTTLVGDTSTSDTLIQRFEISAGATCRFTNKGITKVDYPDTVIAKYARYTGSGTDCTSGNYIIQFVKINFNFSNLHISYCYINCPKNEWYSKAAFTSICYIETIINNGPSQSSQITVYLGNALHLAQSFIALLALVGLYSNMF